MDAETKALRKKFMRTLIRELRVVWPILSGLLFITVILGLVVGWIEGWHIQDAIYFSFITCLTIGYGDFSPTTLLTRVLAIGIGICGMLITAIVAAMAVKALGTTMEPKQ